MKLLYYYIFLKLFLRIRCLPDNCTETQVITPKKSVEIFCSDIDLSIVKQMPKDTTMLTLRFKALDSVSTSTFKGLPNLIHLDLSNNFLSSIHVDDSLPLEDLVLVNNSIRNIPIFSKLPNLLKLVLFNNQITSVPDNAFSGLTNLKELDLGSNNISKLSEQVFEDLLALDSLDLSHNNLVEVPRYLISEAKYLGKLYLTGNKLTTIPEYFFYGVDPPYVYVDQNPWKCDCGLKYFQSWIDENPDKIYVKEDEQKIKNDQFSVICDKPQGTPLLNYTIVGCGRSHDYNPTTVRQTTKDWQTTTREVSTPFWKTSKIATIRPITEGKVLLTTLPTLTSRKSESTTNVIQTVALTKKWQTTTREVSTLFWKTSEIATIRPVTEQKALTSTLPSTHGKTITVKEETTITEEPTTAMLVQTTTTAMVVQTIKSSTVAFKEETKRADLHSPPMLQTAVTILNDESVRTETTNPVMLSTAHFPVSPLGREKHTSCLEETIIAHCCFLHFILYLFILFILLLLTVVTTAWLIWGYIVYHRLSHTLSEDLPMVRLIRYSLLVKRQEDLLHLGSISNKGSNVSRQLLPEATPMLVLEASSLSQVNYTSAIL
ncbi:platelet glycoprotein Ib alpha chain [Bombina bombina]|uniref:platelet glycoprotein Ib alpha chain n=1 Tax=Bombina bombina TaxID=8345 RepID=UPI00235AA94E|nr:platelet glycoprotein Ib alpha chain [Bombina bombina]